MSSQGSGSHLVRWCNRCATNFTQNNWRLHAHNPAQVSCDIRDCTHKAVGHVLGYAPQLLCGVHLTEARRNGHEVTFVDGRGCRVCEGHGQVHAQEIDPETPGVQWVRCPQCLGSGYAPDLRLPTRPQALPAPSPKPPPWQPESRSNYGVRERSGAADEGASQQAAPSSPPVPRTTTSAPAVQATPAPQASRVGSPPTGLGTTLGEPPIDNGQGGGILRLLAVAGLICALAVTALVFTRGGKEEPIAPLASATQDPTPSPSPTPTPSPSAVPTPSPTPSPVPTSSPTPTPIPPTATQRLPQRLNQRLLQPGTCLPLSRCWRHMRLLKRRANTFEQ